MTIDAKAANLNECLRGVFRGQRRPPDLKVMRHACLALAVSSVWRFPSRADRKPAAKINRHTPSIAAAAAAFGANGIKLSAATAAGAASGYDVRKIFGFLRPPPCLHFDLIYLLSTSAFP